MIDGGHEPYLDGLPSAPAAASMPASQVATAAHHVLVGMVVVPPLSSVIVDRLNALYMDSLAADPRWEREGGLGSQLEPRLSRQPCSSSARTTAGTGRSGST